MQISKKYVGKFMYKTPKGRLVDRVTVITSKRDNKVQISKTCLGILLNNSGILSLAVNAPTKNAGKYLRVSFHAKYPGIELPYLPTNPLSIRNVNTPPLKICH